MMQSDKKSGTTLRARRGPVPRIATAVTMTSAAHFFVDRHATVRGVFVANELGFAVGQEILVEVGLHSYVLLLRGRVVFRSKAGDAAGEGLGVTFDDLTGPARWVIESFCARRPAARYDLDEHRSACG